jgi:hypothetical protein
MWYQNIDCIRLADVKALLTRGVKPLGESDWLLDSASEIYSVDLVLKTC